MRVTKEQLQNLNEALAPINNALAMLHKENQLRPLRIEQLSLKLPARNYTHLNIARYKQLGSSTSYWALVLRDNKSTDDMIQIFSTIERTTLTAVYQDTLRFVQVFSFLKNHKEESKDTMLQLLRELRESVGLE